MTITMEPITVTAEDPFAHIEYVDPCPGKKGDEVVWEKCTKCGGTGFINAFGHVDGGKCFDCWYPRSGSARPGRTGRLVRSIRAAEKRRVNEHNKAMDAQREYEANRERLEAEHAAKVIANVETFRTEQPEAWAAIEAIAPAATDDEDLDLLRERGDDFGLSLRDQVEETGSLTERQIEAALAAAARKSAGWLGEEGEKITFTATIEARQSFENSYYYGKVDFWWTLRTVEGDAVRVKSEAQHLFDLAEDEDHAPVTFIATVKEHSEFRGEKQTNVTRIRRAK